MKRWMKSALLCALSCLLLLTCCACDARDGTDVSEQPTVTYGADVIRFVLPEEDAEILSDADAIAAFDDGTTVLDANDLKSVETQYAEGQYVLAIEFNENGTKKFEQITSENVGQYLAIIVDDKLLSYPQINTTISDGKAVIAGEFTLEDARAYEDIIASALENVEAE